MCETIGDSDEAIPLTSQHATYASVSINNADVVLVFISALPMFNKQKGLVPKANLKPLSTISISTIAAKQLVKQISAALDDFERITGSTIPDFGELTSGDMDSEKAAST